jgi:hypothetical protein
MSMSRHPRVQQEYEQRLKDIEEMGLTPEEYLINTLPWANGVAYVPNEFPYEGDFNHFILWFLDKTQEEIDKVLNTIRKHKNCTIIRNHTKDQSVKNLVHYHVFI